MKDATGELSMTAVAVVAIAAIAALFSTLIWPAIRTNILRSTYCSNAFDCTCDGGTGSMCDCYYCPNENTDVGDVATACDEPSEIKCNRSDTTG